ncbi:non-specific serine/threonine protein kinase [Malassezia sp. CBS 17886]|nr:non-specific serine/threonine protein kinase [Malassezia sp. CBS 17886]
MDRAATPSPSESSRLLPTGGSLAHTPATSESFRNVRPLQAAFASSGLVSKRRRGLVSGMSSTTDLSLAHEDVSHTSLDMPRTGSQSISASGCPSRDSFHGRALRDVVESAMADRSFNMERQSCGATMPDTPMKPMFTEAKSSARVHRRGCSMGGVFPSRTPLFPTPLPKSSVSATSLEAPATEMTKRRPFHIPALSLPPNAGPGRHTEAADELFTPASPSHGADAAAIDADGFEEPESPLLGTRSQGAHARARDLKLVAASGGPGELPVRRTRGRPRPSCVMPHMGLSAAGPEDAGLNDHTGLPLLDAEEMDAQETCPSPSRGHPVEATPSRLHPTAAALHCHPAASTPHPAARAGVPIAMDSPNNCFASPARAPAQTAPTSSTPFPRSPCAPPTPLNLATTAALLDNATPLTPTRKHGAGLKWFEAANAFSPPAGAVPCSHAKTRPRHSEPVDNMMTPPARPGATALARSAPPGARFRAGTRLSEFEEHFATESVLGQGEFSEVVKVREKATGRVSAVKRMKRPFLGPKDRIRRLEEVDVLALLKQNRSAWGDAHFGAEGVVDLLDAWEEDGFLFLQTELCPLGTLGFVLTQYGQQVGPLNEARLWKILAELASGVDYIHKCGVLHLDLKPANILITEIGSLKISDFGMATRWPRCTTREILAGAHVQTRPAITVREHTGESSASDKSFGSSPPSPNASVPTWAANAQQAPSAFTFSGASAPWALVEAVPERPRRRQGRQRKSNQIMSLEREGDRAYIAPEVIMESKHGKPADVFSLGLILLEAACSVEIPDNGDAWQKLRSDDFSDVNLDALSPAMHGVITAMVSSRPYMRPTAADLVATPALAAVRDIMRRGLYAGELDQLPAFSALDPNTTGVSNLYRLPDSKYYEAPAGGAIRTDRMVVKLRGALIQEDEQAFLSEVLHAADARGCGMSPDTSTSQMTEDSIPAADPVSPLEGAGAELHAFPPSIVDANAFLRDTINPGMDIDKVPVLP